MEIQWLTLFLLILGMHLMVGFNVDPMILYELNCNLVLLDDL